MLFGENHKNRDGGRGGGKKKGRRGRSNFHSGSRKNPRKPASVKEKVDETTGGQREQQTKKSPPFKEKTSKKFGGKGLYHHGVGDGKRANSIMTIHA